MKKILTGLSVGILLFAITNIASATTIDLHGSYYIQSGDIHNDSGLTITEFVYSLGAAEDYVATWDTFGTGTASEFFGTSWAQTVTWSGLNILSGTSWSFTGLDIDLITNAAAGIVSHMTLDNGSYNSLRNGYLSVVYSDGSTGFAGLIGDAGWQGRHDYVLDHQSVPEPATMLLFGTGLAGLIGVGMRRKK